MKKYSLFVFVAFLIAVQLNAQVPALPPLTPVKNELGLWGYINDKKEAVVPYQYQFAHPFNRNMAWARDDKNYYILMLGADGKVNRTLTDINITKCRPYAFYDSIAMVQNKAEDNVFYVNYKGEKSSPYKVGGFFENGRAEFYDKSYLTGVGNVPGILYKDFSKNVLLKYAIAYNETDNMMVLQGGDIKFSYLDLSTLKFLPNKYKVASNYVKGTALVLADGPIQRTDTVLKIDKTGKELAKYPLQADDFPRWKMNKDIVIYSLSSGKPKFVLTNDFKQIPLSYDTIEMFRHGYAVVRKNGKQGLINDTWEEVFAPQFDFISSKGKYARVYVLNNKGGVLNLDARKIYPARYSKISGFVDDGELYCYIPDGDFYVDFNGVEYKTKQLSVLEIAEKRESEKFNSPFAEPLSDDLGKEIWDKARYNPIRIDSMIRKGVDINKPVNWSKESGDLPLVVAIKQRNLSMFYHFMRLNADVTKLNGINGGGRYGLPVPYYILSGMRYDSRNMSEYKAMLEEVLKKYQTHINNLYGSTQQTLLHEAITSYLDLSVIEMLLKYGANKTVKDGYGRTAYDTLKEYKKNIKEYKGEEYLSALINLVKPAGAK